MSEHEPQKRTSFGLVRTLVLLIAIGVFSYSAWQLYTIFGGYKKANDEYRALEESYTDAFDETKETPAPSADAAVDDTVIDEEPEEDIPEEEEMLVEDAEPPLSVDWEELRKVNPDIVGWVYVDGQSGISYPICLGEDNDYYLHHTFRKEAVFAGAIFMDYHNSSDFADPNTVVYGHNMKNGSMFGMLKFLKDQEKYDEHPYFWILTPDGNYRYHIFSIFLTAVDSEVYTLFGQNSNEFLRWERRIQAQSEVKNSVPLSRNDKTVILSTCTSDSSKRCVVIGKCVSSTRPVRKANARRYQAKPLATPTPGMPEGAALPGGEEEREIAEEVEG